MPHPDGADRLDSFDPTSSPAVWVVGAHGGAAETTIATFLPDAEGTSRRWPRGSRAPVVLVARTHDHGLRAAQRAIQTWAARDTAADVVGIVFVPDAPRRLPAVLRDRVEILMGGVPHAWLLTWSEQLRTGDPHHPDRLWRRFAAELDAVAMLRAASAAADGQPPHGAAAATDPSPDHHSDRADRAGPVSALEFAAPKATQ